MDRDRLAGQIRHAFSAGGPGLGFLIYYMTQKGIPVEQQSLALQAVAWLVGGGGVLIGAGWEWVANSIRSRILSVKKLEGVEVHVDTQSPDTPKEAKDLANDRRIIDVIPIRN